ncbi:Ribonuclease H domain [Sesbania bispinosa]|nr:Ribonuclease H domain [Sesbania bispinosa]
MACVGTLDMVALNHIPVNLEFASVRDMVNERGEWDVAKFSHFLPNEAINDVMGMVPPVNGNDPDKVTWGLTCNGQFSTKSAYHFVMQSSQGPTHKVWKVIWKLKAGDMDTNFFSNDLTNWIYRNVTNHTCHLDGFPWSSVFVVALSTLWHYRNGMVFAAKHVLPNELVRGILCKAAEFNHVLSTHNSANVSKPPTVSASINWTYPTYPFMKCNVDTSLRDGGLKAACGGLFRNETGAWLGGFVRNIGTASITISELWGILSALQMAQSLRVKYLCIETDSKTAVAFISKGVVDSHPCRAIILAIKSLMDSVGVVNISHTYREGNRATDWLADYAFQFTLGYHILPAPPHGLFPILRDDLADISFVRSIFL